MTLAASSAAAPESAETQGDALRVAGQLDAALAAYLRAAAEQEIPPAALCLKLARLYDRLGQVDQLRHWLPRVVDGGDDFVAWQAAATLLDHCQPEAWPAARSARVAVLGSFTTTQFVPLLRLAARRAGVHLELYEGHYGQYRQEIADPSSSAFAFRPDFVLLAVHEGEVALPAFSSSPESAVEAELGRWTGLWDRVAGRSSARVVQFTFPPPAAEPMGHLAARLPGSRHRLLQALNARLGEVAGDHVSLVDCERLAGLVGAERWCDPRYWYLAKHAVAPAMQPLLARHTAAVLAADLGLTRKCLALDLDNTLWGGVIGEDGLAGIAIGDGVQGEAFAAFQDYLLELKRKGILLAVCSKNNPADARAPFEQRPEMRLRLSDFACFMANWQPKAEGIRSIAATLNIGLDAIAFVDDNPAEREAIRQLLPEVDVVPLPAEPSQYVRALANYLPLETRSFTADDAHRTEQYAARAAIAAHEASAGSLEEFYRSLEMQAVVSPFVETDLPRVAQLIGKSNQFNLTTRRHSLQRLNSFMDDPSCVHLTLRLRDRFVDHGLVSVLIAMREGSDLSIDTWLMSCRVIGRTVEAEMLQQLSRRAQRLNCNAILGTYIPTVKNALVADIFERFGFEPVGVQPDGTTTWRYDLRTRGPITNTFIRTSEDSELGHGSPPAA